MFLKTPAHGSVSEVFLLVRDAGIGAERSVAGTNDILIYFNHSLVRDVGIEPTTSAM